MKCCASADREEVVFKATELTETEVAKKEEKRSRRRSINVTVHVMPWKQIAVDPCNNIETPLMVEAPFVNYNEKNKRTLDLFCTCGSTVLFLFYFDLGMLRHNGISVPLYAGVFTVVTKQY